MRKLIILILVILITSCSSPSEFAIQTAIAKTESAIIPESVIQTAIAKTQTTGIPTVIPNNPGSPNNSPSINCEINSPVKNEWDTIMCDTFDKNGNWETGINDVTGADVSIYGGKYYIDYNSNNTQGYTTGFTTALQFGKAKDFVISLDGKIDSKYKNCTWGLIVRGNIHEGYEFSINNQGGYFLTYHGSPNRYIGNLKVGNNSAIKWGSENTITALVEGKKMTFYVNGIQINSYEAKNNSRSEISWSVWADEGVTVLYEFDNLLIKEKSQNTSVLVIYSLAR
ncbi:MAG: hypothetical protein Q8S01_08700, partial [Ignavibacteria bacterium]|nr:hypothetical protein [Ignavibacteria bacterium]